MARTTPVVLIVEDVATLAQVYSSFLARENVRSEWVATGAAARERLSSSPPAVAVIDVNLPDGNGIELLREIRAQRLPTEVVVITSNGSINLAVEAMREGAFDFIVKPCSAERLRVTVRNALERRTLRQAVDTLKDEFGQNGFMSFIGRSVAMQAVYRILQSAAASRATVFVTGESGTGKEVCAETIHKLSGRRGELVAVNCAAIPRDLLESELFGHVKGSFTGASGDRLGAALRADGGTLFLDEIGELELAFQAKMLRFLQTGQVQRIGEDRTRPVDVRIVCATNRDPRAEVAAGRFREDLFYRLYVIPVEMPPLRERDDDVLLLARHLLQRYAADDGRSFTGFSAPAEEMLLRYSWPGNVRELQNLVRKLVVLGTGPDIEPGMLPPEIRASSDGASIASRAAGPQSLAPTEATGARSVLPLDEVIGRAIEEAIAACQGSIPKAAAALKVSPSTIYRRLQAKADA